MFETKFLSNKKTLGNKVATTHDSIGPHGNYKIFCKVKIRLSIWMGKTANGDVKKKLLKVTEDRCVLSLRVIRFMYVH